jgi:hypothetical protein
VLAPLANSTTFIPKATYVPLTVSVEPATGAATQKFAFARALNLQPGEVDAVVSAPDAQPAFSNMVAGGAGLGSVLQQFEGTPLAAQLPALSAFADVSVDALVAFGNALAAHRAAAAAVLKPGDPTAGAAANLWNTALVGVKRLSNSAANPPVGMLNLERLEMSPAGIERGALVATIPLAPKEQTTVVQQEWSVTASEFATIVTDSLENYSQTGVTENTQLTQATTSQVAHSNQFNISASASGGIGFVSGSAATSFGSQDQNSASASDSRTHALQTTQQASSRVTQSHKTSFNVSTTSGQSETSTRVLVNPSDTDPMRVDYFSVMRKWYVALYRYGARLTYDTTVPEPGAALREQFKQLAELKRQAALAFKPPVTIADIDESSYAQLASQFGAQVDPPPTGVTFTLGGGQVQGIDPGSPGDRAFYPLSFTVQPGQQISTVVLNADIGDNPDGSNHWRLDVIGYPHEFTGADATNSDFLVDLTLDNFMAGYSGDLTITTVLRFANPASVTFTVTTQPTATVYEQWQASVFSAIYNAAQSTYFTQQQNYAGQISALQQQIESVDTLTLRREEHDEIMKTVLRWLMGTFDVFMPTAVSDALFKGQPGVDPAYGIDFTGKNTALSSAAWTTVENYEDIVEFINQAVDWDNIIYFLYSYFWDVPESWDFIRQIQHPDATRQAFLRAGSARVVLTVRKGWELAWAYFVAYGSTVLPPNLPSHPYLTIAQEIADYDSTNYPGIPPADPNNPNPLGDDEIQPAGTTCTHELSPSTAPVTITVADSTGFVAGATAVIDTFESHVQEAQTIKAVPDKTHITVAALSNAHRPGKEPRAPFPIVQAGSKGLLIGEWFEYTPTSGIDIAINSDMSSIA